MMLWIAKHPQARPEMLGFIPEFFSADDPRPAREQIAANYHFGGWQPLKGCTIAPDGTMHYPGDPPYLLLFETELRGETIRLYQHAFLAIKTGGTWEVARVD